MKLSTKARYGLKALVDLAHNSKEEPVSISSIALRQKISESYLEQLMLKLRKANIIKSVRGANGGYTLSREADKITVGEVLRVLEGDLTLVECPYLNEDADCDNEHSCVTKYVWKKVNDSINETVDKITIGELMDL
ncbi:MAG: Rrf2 family transcriptional regulator [Lachnospiraceae bacterium]|nr:Rrf2 family transcriptional regulator [Lachnospira sp.]MBR6698102.1 Rrf2 family transcriptional regulator [Lachnospiraceae bacterium]